MHLLVRLAITGALVLPVPGLVQARAASTCSAVTSPLLSLPGRVDTLLADDTAGTIMVLVGQPSARVRFLPHDTLEVFDSNSPATSARAVTIPPYLAAPGLTSGHGGGPLYALVDSTLLILDGSGSGSVARQNLGLQAIGWPAAVTVDSTGNLYLIGQPDGAMEAQAYAYRADGSGTLREQWHTPLGLTHAGAWIGAAGTDVVAVYLPDAHDGAGTVALLDSLHGRLLLSYAVPMPPLASDAAANRLYLAGAGFVRAYALRSGAMVARTSGDAPVATAAGHLSFVRGDHLIVAQAKDLKPVQSIPFPGGLLPTALAWEGSSLLVGNAHGIYRVRLDGCR